MWTIFEKVSNTLKWSLDTVLFSWCWHIDWCSCLLLSNIVLNTEAKNIKFWVFFVLYFYQLVALFYHICIYMLHACLRLCRVVSVCLSVPRYSRAVKKFLKWSWMFSSLPEVFRMFMNCLEVSRMFWSVLKVSKMF